MKSYKTIAEAAGKAMDRHTPVVIYADDCAIWDYIAGIEGDRAIITEHFGTVGILDDAATVYPWDMAEGDRPMLCTSGVTLKWTGGTHDRSWYESTHPNRKGETLVAEVDTVRGFDGASGLLLREWAKRGFIKPMTSAWNTTVYVRKDGKTMQAYNPQIKPDGSIAFGWILEHTEAHRLALLLEILKRFGKAEATQSANIK